MKTIFQMYMIRDQSGELKDMNSAESVEKALRHKLLQQQLQSSMR